MNASTDVNRPRDSERALFSRRSTRSANGQRPARERQPGTIGSGQSSDEELLHGAHGGDPRAFAVFHERHAKRLYRLAASVLNRDTGGAGGAGDAEDVYQEAMLVVIRRADSYDPDSGSVVAWVSGIIINIARERRKAKRHGLSLAPSDLGRSLDSDPRVACEDTYFPYEIDFAGVIRALPRRQREVFVLRTLCELTTRETAQALGLSEESVRQHKKFAVDALAPRLDQVLRFDPAPGEVRARDTREERHPMVAAPRCSPVIVARRAFAF